MRCQKCDQFPLCPSSRRSDEVFSLLDLIENVIGLREIRLSSSSIPFGTRIHSAQLGSSSGNLYYYRFKVSSTTCFRVAALPVISVM
jgi:hypothetical protein